MPEWLSPAPARRPVPSMNAKRISLPLQFLISEALLSWKCCRCCLHFSSACVAWWVQVGGHCKRSIAKVKHLRARICACWQARAWHVCHSVLTWSSSFSEGQWDQQHIIENPVEEGLYAKCFQAQGRLIAAACLDSWDSSCTKSGLCGPVASGMRLFSSRLGPRWGGARLLVNWLHATQHQCAHCHSPAELTLAGDGNKSWWLSNGVEWTAWQLMWLAGRGTLIQGCVAVWMCCFWGTCEKRLCGAVAPHVADLAPACQKALFSNVR